MGGLPAAAAQQNNVNTQHMMNNMRMATSGNEIAVNTDRGGFKQWRTKAGVGTQWPPAAAAGTVY